MKVIDGERKLEGLRNDVTAGWYAMPTRDDIDSLMIGDLVPTCFGRLSEVTVILYRGINIHGKAYVGYNQRFGDDGQISGSMTEGEYIATIPMTSKYNRRECYPA